MVRKKPEGAYENSEEEEDRTDGSKDSKDPSNSSKESLLSEEEDQSQTDRHGPRSSAKAPEALYSKKRVDAKETTCILYNKTLGLYFKTM